MSNQDIHQRLRTSSEKRKAFKQFHNDEEMKKKKKKQSQSIIYTIGKGIVCVFGLSAGVLLTFPTFSIKYPFQRKLLVACEDIAIQQCSYLIKKENKQTTVEEFIDDCVDSYEYARRRRAKEEAEPGKKLKQESKFKIDIKKQLAGVWRKPELAHGLALNPSSSADSARIPDGDFIDIVYQNQYFEKVVPYKQIMERDDGKGVLMQEVGEQIQYRLKNAKRLDPEEQPSEHQPYAEVKWETFDAEPGALKFNILRPFLRDRGIKTIKVVGGEEVDYADGRTS